MKKLILLSVISIFTFMLTAQDIENLYVVGPAFECEWDADEAYPMEKKDNGIFSWTGDMKAGDFKFLLKTNSDDVWVDNLNSKIEDERIIIGQVHELVHEVNNKVAGGGNDYKFRFYDKGSFKVTVDTKNMTLVIETDKLISVSKPDGRGKRIVNIHSCSGKTNGDESPYKLLIGRAENLKDIKNKWAYDGDDPWVIFSLSGIYSVYEFEFRDARAKEVEDHVHNIPEYKIFVSTTGTEDKDWTEVAHQTGVEDQDVKTKKITPVEARYIKFVPVKNPADEYIRIYGFDIYGEFVRSLNEDIISTGKPIVDYHESWSHRETPANIVDGNSEPATGEDANNPWAFRQSRNPGWVIIDLEEKSAVSKFVLTDSEEWLTGYRVYVSNFAGKKDNEWKLVADQQFDKELVKKEITLEKPVEGRYIKLEIPIQYQQGLTRIREFEVYGVPATKPGINTNHADLKAAYDLAVWTTELNETQDGILKAGARYANEWTRDLSINVWNGYPLLEPEISKHSLLSLLDTSEKQLVRHEYWDKIIWIKGAYMYYLYTGDIEFLDQVLKSGMNTMEELENMKQGNYPVFDVKYGLFNGPSVFNDGIAGYETPVYSGDGPGGAVVSHPAHTQIKCLSTNCIYYEGYRLLAKVAHALGDDLLVPDFEEKAANLKSNIRKHLFNETTGKLYYLIDQNNKQHEFQEGLGISFAVMFDIVTEEEAEKIIADAYVTKHGLPSIYPHFKRFNDAKPGRHNMMIWPFVNGFFADACLKAGNLDKYKFELFNLADLGVNKGDNNFYEIYDPKDAKPDGGWQTGGHWGPLEHQTWSATGFLNMVWSGLAGIQLQDNSIFFTPYLPEELEYIELTKLKYGDMLLNIKVEGEGTKIKEFKVNGVPSGNYSIDRTLTGEQNIHIILEQAPLNISETKTAEQCFSAFSENRSVSIQMNKNYIAESVELFDISGKSIASHKKANGNFTIGQNLSTGIYTVKVDCEGNSQSAKVAVF